ncbi:class I SAM-dependent methyltransferase [Chromobacterium sp. IIBBL 290-4]|uniref:class I SAM-dependent methyltransferase n=1 Tax=Chromobacterium sp. IIBBL 290-4 TaxID=2953890 RepID=UPI0020B6859A|nr:class I SAM-dependent methyltransferase [Chromobacterium sp. IIBBL 290-4]UTH74487.1 class I SAM-dependent methyltransferase [Chromobacterium sp. IIBBL 290-4]
MTISSNHSLIEHNRGVWDSQARADCEWSRPVDAAAIRQARGGDLSACRLTPSALPAGWLDPLRGKEVLCLAAGGGQQAPLLAAAGARVTVLDVSDEQLARDRQIAAREGLALRLEQGDMSDLSRFADGSFDCVFHPISNLYVPDVKPVWRECARVLRPGGSLLASFYNPVLFVADRDPAYAEQGLIKPRFAIPYSDLRDLPAEERAAKLARGEALVFGHSLADLIGGQTAAGLLIRDYLEECQPRPRFLIDRYLPTFIATWAVKAG